MIYGYDSDERILYIADHFRQGRFSFSTCTFDALKTIDIAEIENSFPVRTVEECRELRFFRFDDRPTLNWYTRLPFIGNAERKRHRFGLDCYDLLIQHINWIWDKEDIFIRTGHSLYVEYCHKLMMVERIRYLGEKGILKEYAVHMEKYETFKKSMYLEVMVFLKCIISGKYPPETRASLIARLQRIKADEREEIERILKDFK